MKFVPCSDEKEGAGDLKRVYQSTTEDEALHELDPVEEKWRVKYPLITGQGCQQNTGALGKAMLSSL